MILEKDKQRKARLEKARQKGKGVGEWFKGLSGSGSKIGGTSGNGK
jgi:adenylylsulfate kinase-like enzyme